MCGIFGLIDTPWRDAAPAALASIATRGPDDSGIWHDERAWLGHRRLSIIDLAGGHQPMQDATGRYTIVFNGEIYNFADLRKELTTELTALGIQFRTHSDTEVLLAGYQIWGRDLLQRLDGMFAFAIWDATTRTLFAARDRVGIKPLFYSTHQGFSFASTLKPFLAIKGFPRWLNMQAVRDYLGFQCINAPRSILQDVQQLPPAHWLHYSADTKTLQQACYWHIPGPQSRTPTLQEMTAETDAALSESVRMQMMSEVPLGAFLSGGIDSSLMVHYMAQAQPMRQSLQTFSVRFAQEGFDETAHAQAVAQQYGTQHHIIDAPEIDADTYTQAIAALDQPLADPAYITTYVLSRLTRQHVTVAISGDGGDELFGGYARYRDVEAHHPRSIGKGLLRQLINAGLLPGSLLRRSLFGKELLLYRKLDLGPWATSRKSLARYLTPDALAAAQPQDVLQEWQTLASSFNGEWNSDSLMRADLWSYLSENCLTKTDRASMAHSLEVRVPMLGNRVIDTALRWPARAHLNSGDGQGKAALRALAKQHLPETVWNRPKHGFSVPLGYYFATSWRAIGDELVQQAARGGLFQANAIRALWTEAQQGKSRRLAYSVLSLLLWLKQEQLI